jgi:threonyl-tRNA synthetase
MLVLGAKEIENGTVAVRDRTGAQENMTVIDFIEKIKKAVLSKV